MRYIIYGAGGIGGVVGGRLAEHGHDVQLIARGEHATAIRRDGLRIESVDSTDIVHLTVAEHPSEIDFDPDDVVMIAVKSQGTAAALEALSASAGPDVSVVCLQNGVDNERMALRLFHDVYAVPVMCPAEHLEPGVVSVFSSPIGGIFDIGRYPTGSDALCSTISAAFESATFVSEVRNDIMRWKWAKLLNNLSNAIEAACGTVTSASRLVAMVRSEGENVLRAAGIDFATQDEDRERRGSLVNIRPAAGRRRNGGSSWQSLARGLGSIETDFLNGEIVLLGRLHGVPTPANETLQRIATRMAWTRSAPGALTEDDVIAEIAATS